MTVSDSQWDLRHPRHRLAAVINGSSSTCSASKPSLIPMNPGTTPSRHGR